MTIQFVSSSPVRIENVAAASSSRSSGATPSIGALLPEPGAVDVGLAVAQMTIENAYTMKKQARADRGHASEAMIASQRQQIAELRKEADERHTAALFDAWGKITEGSFGAAGGLMSAGALHWAKPAKFTLDESKGIGEATSAGGRLGAGVSSLFAAGEREEADLANVAAKEAENEATAQKRVLDDADADAKTAEDHARRALDFLRDFRAAEDRAMSSAIRG